MKKVFVIILNWNGGQLTVDCLESLEGMLTNGLKVEVAVIDNGSTDNSVEMIKDFVEKNSHKFVGGTKRLEGKKEVRVPPIRINSRKPTIKLIENRTNLGFAEGNNVGVRYALKNSADYVCILNNDTRVAPDFLTQLIKVADSDKGIGIVGGKIYFEKGYEFHKDKYEQNELGKVIWYAGGVIDWSNVYTSHRGVDEVDHGQYDLPASLASSHLARLLGMETEYVNGCLMLVKKEVFEKVGLLDSKYFAYFEENDFCQKAKKAGFKLFYAPKSVIWHLNAQSSGPGSSLHDYFLTRNRLLFGMKWAPLRSRIALVKESLWMLFKARKWQRIGVRDFYLGKFGKGRWNG